MRLIQVTNSVDGVTGITREKFKFIDTDGKTSWSDAERDVVLDRLALCRRLLNADAALPPHQGHALRVIDDAIAQNLDRLYLFPRSAGWRPDLKAYLLGDKGIGQCEASALCPPGGPDVKVAIELLHLGNLKRWRRRVAGPALGFPPWVAALCAMYTAPLLAHCAWPAFRLHLFGDTPHRRLAPLHVAGSTFGLGAAHIIYLSDLSVGSRRDVARLLMDTAFIVNEPRGGRAN
jgi:hypothetical protein